MYIYIFSFNYNKGFVETTQIDKQNKIFIIHYILITIISNK